jgi:hypothetical protein
MDDTRLRDALQLISATYDRHHELGYDQPAQLLLERIRDEIGHLAPVGFRVGGSGQKPFPLTTTPWIGLLDSDESTTFMEGIYIVYLYSDDLTRVYLSLNQGTEKLRRNHKLSDAEARKLLAARATDIRARMTSDEQSGTTETIHLALSGTRQKSYEAGNIIALEYDTNNLPGADTLNSDLSRFINLYARSLQIRNELAMAGELGFVGDAEQPDVAEQQGLAGFNPKDDSDYLAEIAGRKLVKSRRHETIVQKFGPHAQGRGFSPTTPHPIDVKLDRNGASWIVEVKVVYGNNYAQAVRAAIGQLFEYRMVFDPEAQLVALFDKPIGGIYLKLLSSLGISTIWPGATGWNVISDDEALESLGGS